MENSDSATKAHRGVSRRNLLKGASVGVATSLVTPVLTGWSQSGRPDGAAGAKSPMVTPASLPKAWSVGEIQRRWQAVRQEMKKANIDCLIVTQHHPGEMITERQDGDADVEYLTGISLPLKWVIFPVDGKVTALSSGQLNGSPEEKLCQDRGIEVVINQGEWSRSIIDSLRGKNMAQARIGVTDLVNASRQPEGEVSYTTYDRVLKAFPQATFVPTSDLMTPVQIVHSPEEVGVFQKSVQVGEMGLQTMFQTAHSGVIHRVVWLAMFNTMVNASGERPWRLSIRTGGGGNSALNRPLEEVMAAGKILSQECTGSVLGYGTQVNRSILIGSPAPPDWADAAKDAIDTFHDMVALIAPGKTVKEICAPFDKRLVARGEKPGALVIHSGGLGTMPRGGSAGETGDIVIREGMVFDVKPVFRVKGAGTAQFGDSIVVTDKGARRLGTLEMKVMAVS